MSSRRLLSQLIASPAGAGSPRRTPGPLSPAALCSSPLIPPTTTGDQLFSSPPREQRQIFESPSRSLDCTFSAISTPSAGPIGSPAASPLDAFSAPIASFQAKSSSSLISSPINLRSQYRFASSSAAERKNKPLSGQVLCFTGALNDYTRSAATRLAKKHGAQVVTKVTKRVTALVGADPQSGSSKMKEAKKLGVKQWSEKKFFQRMKLAALVGAVETKKLPKNRAAAKQVRSAVAPKGVAKKQTTPASDDLLDNLLGASPSPNIKKPVSSVVRPKVVGQKIKKPLQRKEKSSHDENLIPLVDVAQLMRNVYQNGEKMDRELLKSLPMVAAYPELVAWWKGKKGNYTIKAEWEKVDSLKKVRWECSHCGHPWKETIRGLVMRDGKCPSCDQTGPRKLPEKKEKDLVGKLTWPGFDSPRGLGVINFTELSKRKVKPELAYSWEKDHIKRMAAGKPGLFTPEDPIYVSPKLDGIRCVVRLGDKPSDDPVFVSRNGVRLECCDHLVPLFKQMLFQDPEAVFDGELYIHQNEEIGFDDISGLCRTLRKHRTEEIARKQAMIQFHCFGMMYGKRITKETSFEDRRSHLKDLAKLLSPADRKKFKVVEQVLTTTDQVSELNQQHVLAGYEGSMVRDARLPYQIGKRTKGLLKVKSFMDSEYRIIGFQEGKGEMENHLGAFICVDKKTNKTFGATPSIPTAQKKAIWNSKKAQKSLLDKMLTVKYFETTKDNVPRFPIAKAVRGSLDGSDWL